ncbi:MAG: YetF domain-containing protein [Pyrinomonadaceae bacterium]
MFIEIFPAVFEGSAWSHMFTLDNDKIFWIEKIVRPVIVYFVLILLLRVFGKRELGQLNPFDLVVILSLSNTVQNAIIGEDNSLVGGVVGAAALLGINYVIAVLKYNSQKFETIIEGKPLTIIENNKVNKKAVRSELLTKDDLNTIAHREGLNDADEMEKCILDSNGDFLVEGNTRTSEENFRREVLQRLEQLTLQLEKIETNN